MRDRGPPARVPVPGKLNAPDPSNEFASAIHEVPKFHLPLLPYRAAPLVIARGETAPSLQVDSIHAVL